MCSIDGMEIILGQRLVNFFLKSQIINTLVSVCHSVSVSTTSYVKSSHRKLINEQMKRTDHNDLCIMCENRHFFILTCAQICIREIQLAHETHAFLSIVT